MWPKTICENKTDPQERYDVKSKSVYSVRGSAFDRREAVLLIAGRNTNGLKNEEHLKNTWKNIPKNNAE